MFISILFSNPIFYLMQLMLVVFSICCHEYMHARMALWQGDRTAAANGHLTLNPMKQMGLMSLIMCAVIGFAWGVVPVNPQNFRNRYSDFLVSFAGPMANLGLFVFFCFLGSIVYTMKLPHMLLFFFFIGSSMNIVLFLLNMLPLPMLDGGKIFSFLFPQMRRVNSEVKNGLTTMLFFIVLFSFDRLWNIGYKVSAWVIELMGQGLAFFGM